MNLDSPLPTFSIRAMSAHRILADASVHSALSVIEKNSLVKQHVDNKFSMTTQP